MCNCVAHLHQLWVNAIELLWLLRLLFLLMSNRALIRRSVARVHDDLLQIKIGVDLLVQIWIVLQKDLNTRIIVYKIFECCFTLRHMLCLRQDLLLLHKH